MLENKFTIKDSGKRENFQSGMRRDTDEGKPRYDLIPINILKRWAIHMAKGAHKYGQRNWEMANSEEELDRFKASAHRHFIQWISNERDEDHMAAVMFNLAAYETTKDRVWRSKEKRPVAIGVQVKTGGRTRFING